MHRMSGCVASTVKVDVHPVENLPGNRAGYRETVQERSGTRGKKEPKMTGN